MGVKVARKFFAIYIYKTNGFIMVKIKSGKFMEIYKIK